MITFSPIQKLIQETLHQKMKMLDKVPSNQTGINEPTTGDGGVPQENYMFARSVFLRMTSLLTRNNKPIVLMGGELFEGQYRKGLSVYGPKSGGVKEENPNLRPMAGVKDVNVEYAGGGMKIGATRKTSISWTCWTWDELQKFKPFFLTHGKNVLIEFGWGFQGSDAPMMLDIIKENGEINEDLINGAGAASGSLQEKIPEFILEQKGHYDAVLGTINNFEFSVNETGGFDCTTDLVSMGVNTMRKMDSKESVDGHIANLPIVSPKTYWLKTDESSSSQIADKNPYYSFKSYMMSLEGHLHLNALNSKGSIAYILGGDTPYCTWGWFEDNVLSRFAGQINADKNTVVGEFRSIENIYDDEGKQIDVQPTLMRVSREILPIDFSPKGWFWVYPEQVSDDENFWKNTTLRQDNSKLIPELNSYHESTTLGAFKLMFAPPYLQKANVSGNGLYQGQDDKGTVTYRWKKSFLGSETATWNDDEAYFRPFKTDTSSNGVIRNIYFGHEFLTECFDKSTIKEGIDSVWSKFSAAYGGIYDFGIEFDDKEGRLMIKDREFANKKVSKVLENTSRNPISVDAGYQNDGVFVFPIWEKNSIVKSQNLSAKLPSRMQVAAMYGNNSPEVGDGLIDTMEDWGAIAMGRNEREVEEDENKEQKLLDSLLGSVEEPFRRGEKGNQFTFGNATANDNKPLQWKVGKSVNTTDIYEDLSDKDLSVLNDSFGKGINEVMDVFLTKEFKKRLFESSGFETQAEYDKSISGGFFGPEWSLEKQQNEAEKQIDTFNSTTTNKGAMKLLYDNIVEYSGVTVNHNSNSAKHNKWPVMKAEYHALLKSTLKGEDGGIVKTTDPLVPIELEIEIDGTGGIFPGNSFHSSYLPQSYMERMCFQVIGASHKIDSAGWTTTLKGQMRVAGLDKLRIPSEAEIQENINSIRPGNDLREKKKAYAKEQGLDPGSMLPGGLPDLTENRDYPDEGVKITPEMQNDLDSFEKILKKKDSEMSFYESLKAKFTKKKTEKKTKKITKSVSTPTGEIKAVAYNDNTTGFSADVARQFNFREPMD